MKTVKTLAAVAVLACLTAAPAFAIKTCTRGSADCSDSNGPSLNGLADGGIKVVVPIKVELPGRKSQPVKTCTRGAECADSNGPELSGLIEDGVKVGAPVSVELPKRSAPSIKTCTRNSADCSESNGPSVNGTDAAIKTGKISALDLPEAVAK